MGTSAILMDPLRSALVLMAIEEGLLSVPEGIDLRTTPAFVLGSSQKRRAAVMEFLLLHDTLKLIHHETPGAAAELANNGKKAISLLPLLATGLVEFDGREPVQTGLQVPIERSLSAFWRANREAATAWAPILAEYVFAKGHVQSLSAARAYCRQIAEDPDSLDRIALPALHFSMMSTFGELLQVESIVSTTGASATQTATRKRLSAKEVNAPYRIMQIMVDELFDEGLSLPVPRTIREAAQLQGDQNLRAFKEVFQPWISTLRTGTFADESRLRLEVRQSLRSFKNNSRVRRLNKVLAYVGVPIGLVQGIDALVVAGTAIGIAGIGLSSLAERWSKSMNRTGFRGGLLA